jgi:hypothetical protein
MCQCTPSRTTEITWIGCRSKGYLWRREGGISGKNEDFFSRRPKPGWPSKRCVQCRELVGHSCSEQDLEILMVATAAHPLKRSSLQGCRKS